MGKWSRYLKAVPWLTKKTSWEGISVGELVSGMGCERREIQGIYAHLDRLDKGGVDIGRHLLFEGVAAWVSVVSL